MPILKNTSNRKKSTARPFRKFIAAMPGWSMQGIDIDLSDVNPSTKWRNIVLEPCQRLDDRTFDLAQQRYLAATTDTDLDGRGSFAGVAPGTYWIGMIGIQAISGDVRLRWDLPVTVRPGETTHVELTQSQRHETLPGSAKFKPLRFFLCE